MSQPGGLLLSSPQGPATTGDGLTRERGTCTRPPTGRALDTNCANINVAALNCTDVFSQLDLVSAL